eukprot:CAMPEP_0170526030 /NCGR_PEP_ID=MMETSP0209-20121228/11500_1 /TAXON_ID=665100 ORGANISM="Litonotus pictus, Strain P1" /NCGR_SAMPLE_ID=MMETSP0209 /ASSEMBLY_ACC=CAM_ASM_000301 /LENGTH=186 /DNA_ID=CAMNT_0010815643 /DNA_START=1016 /DNA_END=1572 /DNA_ORIENTATION=-
MADVEKINKDVYTFQPKLLKNKYDGYDFKTLNNISKLDPQSYGDHEQIKQEYQKEIFNKNNNHSHERLYNEDKVKRLKQQLAYAKTNSMREAEKGFSSTNTFSTKLNNNTNHQTEPNKQMMSNSSTTKYTETDHSMGNLTISKASKGHYDNRGKYIQYAEKPYTQTFGDLQENHLTKSQGEYYSVS